MKSNRTAIRPQVPVIISVLLVGMGLYAWSWLSGGTGTRQRGFAYGNLWIVYGMEKRKYLDDEVGYLIAIPEAREITSRGGNGDQYFVYYRDGKGHSFLPDPASLTWVNRGTGPMEVPADLTGGLVRRIEASREDAKGMTFTSGGGLLEWLEPVEGGKK